MSEADKAVEALADLDRKWWALREAVTDRVEHHGREAVRLAEQVTTDNYRWTQERVAWHRAEAEVLAAILASIDQD